MLTKQILRIVAGILIPVMLLTAIPIVAIGSEKPRTGERTQDTVSSINAANDASNTLLIVSVVLLVVTIIAVLARRKPSKKHAVPPAPADTTSGYRVPTEAPLFAKESSGGTPGWADGSWSGIGSLDIEAGVIAWRMAHAPGAPVSTGQEVTATASAK